MRSVLLPLAAFIVTGAHAQVLFSDDFNDGDAAGWQQFDGQFSVVNGEYRVQSLAFCGDARSVNGDPSLTDFSLELDFFIDSSATSRHAAVLFRVQDITSGCDAGHYYQFHAFPTFVGFCKISDSAGSCQILATAPHSTTNFVWHHLRIEVVGSAATAYIDGQLVLTYASFTDYPSGRIGVKAVNAITNRYDNVIVSAYPPQAIAWATPLLLGQVATILVGSPSPNAPIYALLDVATGSVPLGVYGYTQIALSPVVTPLAAPTAVFGPTLTNPYTTPTGSWSITAAVPNDPVLIGMQFYFEAYVLDLLAPNGLFRQTNLLTLVPQ